MTTEKEIIDAIIKRYAFNKVRPRYVVAVQVHDAAGFNFRRRLDAVVLDTWPSKGMSLHGMEIKVSKADLRKELVDPAKMEQFIERTGLDYFSIVTPKGVANLDLIPERYGWILLNDNGKLVTRRKALRLTDQDKIYHVPRSFMAAFCRALIQRSISDEGIRQAREEGLATGRQEADYKVGRLEHKLTALETNIADFEEASGIEISKSWGHGKMGEAVNLILNGGLQKRLHWAKDIRQLGERMIQLADELDDLKEKFDWRKDGTD